MVENRKINGEAFEGTRWQASQFWLCTELLRVCQSFQVAQLLLRFCYETGTEMGFCESSPISGIVHLSVGRKCQSKVILEAN